MCHESLSLVLLLLTSYFLIAVTDPNPTLQIALWVITAIIPDTWYIAPSVLIYRASVPYRSGKRHLWLSSFSFPTFAFPCQVAGSFILTLGGNPQRIDLFLTWELVKLRLWCVTIVHFHATRVWSHANPRDVVHANPSKTYSPYDGFILISHPRRPLL